MDAVAVVSGTRGCPLPSLLTWLLILTWTVWLWNDRSDDDDDFDPGELDDVSTPAPVVSFLDMNPANKVRRASRVNLKMNPMQALMEAKRKKEEEEEAKRIAGSGTVLLCSVWRACVRLLLSQRFHPVWASGVSDAACRRLRHAFTWQLLPHTPLFLLCV